MATPRELLRRMFNAAIASAQPARCIGAHLPNRNRAPRGRLIVICAGKASAARACAVEDQWPGAKSQLEGLVVTHYGHAVPCNRIEIVEAVMRRVRRPILPRCGVGRCQSQDQTLRTHAGSRSGGRGR